MSDTSNTKNHVENFVASVQSDNHADAKSHFDALIASKVESAFEAKKVELGRRISVPEETGHGEEGETLDEAQDMWKVEFKNGLNPGSKGTKIKRGATVEVKARNTAEAGDKAVMKLAGVSKADAKQMADHNSKTIKVSKAG